MYIQYILHVCAQRCLYFSKFSEIAKVGKIFPHLSCCRISCWIRNISTRNTSNFAQITHVSDTSKPWRKQHVSCSKSDCWVSINICWLDLATLATQKKHELIFKKVSQRLPSSGRPLTYQLGWESKYPIDGYVLVSVSEHKFSWLMCTSFTCLAHHQLDPSPKGIPVSIHIFCSRVKIRWPSNMYIDVLWGKPCCFPYLWSPCRNMIWECWSLSDRDANLWYQKIGMQIYVFNIFNVCFSQYKLKYPPVVKHGWLVKLSMFSHSDLH